MLGCFSQPRSHRPLLLNQRLYLLLAGLRGDGVGREAQPQQGCLQKCKGRADEAKGIVGECAVTLACLPASPSVLPPSSRPAAAAPASSPFLPLLRVPFLQG